MACDAGEGSSRHHTTRRDEDDWRGQTFSCKPDLSAGSIWTSDIRGPRQEIVSGSKTGGGE